MLTRALIQRRGSAEFRLAVWAMFFCACLAFTFTGKDVEQAADLFFGGLPVSVYIKYFAMTQLAYIYFVLLNAYKPVAPMTSHVLRGINGFAVFAGVLTFALLALSNSPDHRDVRYFVNAGRDTVVSIFMILALLPRHIEMLRLENVQTMRIKHIIYCLLCITYMTVALTSLISLLIVVFDLVDMDRLLPVFLPLTYVAYTLFLFALVPHRWMVIMLFPARLYTYRRLRRLQRKVEALAQRRVHFDPVPLHPFSLGELEFAIYQTVIAILDHAAHLPETAPQSKLTHRLTHFLQTKMEYPTLVKGLAGLHYE
jgi:hypothetical protein